MDLLKKIETLLNATARAGLPRRKRSSILDEEEEKLLAEIRRAVAGVQAQEQVLAQRLKQERAQAREAAEQGKRAEQQAHERRAAELEYQLEQESIQAINLEEKLAALEEKLAQAKEAVDRQAKAAAAQEAEADKVLAQGGQSHPPRLKELVNSSAAGPDEEPPDISTRKARLSDIDETGDS